MRQGGVSICTSANTFSFARPKIYNGSAWVDAIPFIYDGSWKMSEAAGTQMVYFLTKTNEYFLDSSGKYFLVREQ